MKLSKRLSDLIVNCKKSLQEAAGFTMIELLIVISILGILAVAVLSAINPLEQIRRGQDTGTRSDVEQLLSAIDRYNAFNGYQPWQQNAADDINLGIALTLIDATGPMATTVGGVQCHILERLASGNADQNDDCVGADELRVTFTERIVEDGRPLYVYNRGQQGDSTYVCFVPQSGAFLTEAEDRCTGILPADLAPITSEVCDTTNATIVEVGAAICLP